MTFIQSPEGRSGVCLTDEGVRVGAIEAREHGRVSPHGSEFVDPLFEALSRFLPSPDSVPPSRRAEAERRERRFLERPVNGNDEPAHVFDHPTLTKRRRTLVVIVNATAGSAYSAPITAARPRLTACCRVARLSTRAPTSTPWPTISAGPEASRNKG